MPQSYGGYEPDSYESVFLPALGNAGEQIAKSIAMRRQQQQMESAKNAQAALDLEDLQRKREAHAADIAVKRAQLEEQQRRNTSLYGGIVNIEPGTPNANMQQSPMRGGSYYQPGLLSTNLQSTLGARAAEGTANRATELKKARIAAEATKAAAATRANAAGTKPRNLQPFSASLLKQQQVSRNKGLMPDATTNLSDYLAASSEYASEASRSNNPKLAAAAQAKHDAMLSAVQHISAGTLSTPEQIQAMKNKFPNDADVQAVIEAAWQLKQQDPSASWLERLKAMLQ